MCAGQAARGAMLAASVNLPIQGNALSDAFIGLTGRRMLSVCLL